MAGSLDELVAQAPPGQELLVVGPELTPSSALAAYRAGLFPMGVGRGGRRPMGWWSPDPRGVLPLDRLHVSRSLRRSLPRFEVRVDTAFASVVDGCADRARRGRWITPAVAQTYQALHASGWAHSVEVWRRDELVGGLYGIAIGGLFAGESMFHRVSDASKVALAATVRLLDDGTPGRLFDVQWRTDHLATLGVVEIPRPEYLRRLGVALTLPPPAFASRPRR